MKIKNIKPEHKVSNNYKPWLVSSLLLLADIVAITLGFYLAFLIRYALIPILGGTVELEILSPLLWMLIIIIPVLFLIAGLYPGVGRTGLTEFREIFSIITLSFTVLGFSVFVIGYGSLFSRAVFLLSWFFTAILILVFRLILHNRGSLKSWWGAPIAIFGERIAIDEVLAHIFSSRRLGYKPVAIVSKEIVKNPDRFTNIPSFVYSPELLQDLSNQGIKTAVISSPTIDLPKNQNKLLHDISLNFRYVLYVMRDSPLSSLDVRMVDIEGHPAIHAQYNLLNPLYQLIKRVLDLLICIITLVFSILIFSFIALAIRFDSPGPVVFIQQRIGKNGKVFNLFKFRTMEIEAESKLEEILQNNEELQKEFIKHRKIRRDPRITSVGKFLRKTSLDELPQIFNVLKGEMSLVGPRAYLPSEKSLIGESDKVIQRVAPGLTGWWQVMGRHEVPFETRLQMDEYYISNFSLWMDAYIGIKTIWVVISGSGV